MFRITIRRAARFSTLLHHAREGIEALIKLTRARRNSAAAQRLPASAQRREIRIPCAGAPFEEAFPRLRVSPMIDSMSSVTGIDEEAEHCGLRLHAHVEPHRRIEGHLLLDLRCVSSSRKASRDAHRPKYPPLRPHRTMYSPLG